MNDNTDITFYTIKQVISNSDNDKVVVKLILQKLFSQNAWSDFYYSLLM